MRTPLVIVFAFALAALPARAAACASGWRVDHYVYDAALHRDWAVLANCAHPAAPARMQLTARADENAHENKDAITVLPEARRDKASRDSAPAPCVKAGDALEVSNPANSIVSMQLSGIAMQSASLGQTIRVRLNPEGSFVHAIVRGPHRVELAAANSRVWRQP